LIPPWLALTLGVFSPFENVFDSFEFSIYCAEIEVCLKIEAPILLDYADKIFSKCVLSYDVYLVCVSIGDFLSELTFSLLGVIDHCYTSPTVLPYPTLLRFWIVFIIEFEVPYKLSGENFSFEDTANVLTVLIKCLFMCILSFW